MGKILNLNVKILMLWERFITEITYHPPHMYLIFIYCFSRVFPGASVVKNPPVNAGDLGLIPGLGRFPSPEESTHLSILAWRIPRTEESGGLQSTGSQRVGYD